MECSCALKPRRDEPFLCSHSGYDEIESMRLNIIALKGIHYLDKGVWYVSESIVRWSGQWALPGPKFRRNRKITCWLCKITLSGVIHVHDLEMWTWCEHVWEILDLDGLGFIRFSSCSLVWHTLNSGLEILRGLPGKPPEIRPMNFCYSVNGREGWVCKYWSM